MKRVLTLVFLLLLLLTGCAGTPQSRESGATAVVSVLGVEPAGQGIHLLAAAEGRAGLSNPFRWQALSSQWPTAFSTLPVEVSVTITVTERQ